MASVQENKISTASNGQRGDKRRKRILRALHDCIIEKGYAKTTLADIAKEAEMCPSHLLYYFEGKDAILGYYFKNVSEKILVRIKSHYDKSPEQQIDLLAELFFAGKEFNVKPGCPNLIERIESGLLSCGNDFDNGDNPFECGYDKYIDIKSDINFLGKKALIKISKEGIKRKLMGVKIDLDKIEMLEERPIQNGKSLVGHLRSAAYSPHFKKVVGIAMIKKEYWDKKTTFELKIGDKKSKGSICDLPLV